MDFDLIVSGARVVDSCSSRKEASLYISNGTITSIVEGRCEKKNSKFFVDASGLTVVPGFIDLHLHGDKESCGNDNPVMVKACEHTAGGTTSFLDTLSTTSRKGYKQAHDYFKDACSSSVNCARPVGIHLEGPFLNPDMAGAQPERYIEKPSSEYLDFLDGLFGNSLKMMTLAPELNGAVEIIKRLNSRGVVVAAGHSNATFEETEKGIESGIKCATHVFNRMRPLHHREPGILGAVLSDDRILAEIIADGVHIDFILAKLIVKLKDASGVIASTDCVQQIDGKKKRRTPRTEKGVLAGSHLTMADVYRNLINFVGVTEDVAVQLTSSNAAKLLGLNDRGYIKEGYKADIVLLDNQYDVQKTVVNGEIVFDKCK